MEKHTSYPYPYFIFYIENKYINNQQTKKRRNKKQTKQIPKEIRVSPKTKSLYAFFSYGKI